MGSTTFVGRRHEQGQTIILVAVALIALLSMAALAIDVVTLYVARSEAQRAANAAAIAGAKMFATSGFTSVQGAVLQTDVCQSGGPGLPAAANIQAAAVAAQNTVAGHVATIQRIQCAFPSSGNPQITVTINQGGLPTFFARIWSRALNSVSATAVAEAYNPSGLQPPIQVSVKPWLVANCDPSNAVPANPNCAASSYFVDPNDGTIENNGNFVANATPIVFSKVPFGTNPSVAAGKLPYYPLAIPVAPAPVCPSTGAASCSQVTSLDYLDNIACTSQFKVKCGDPIGPGDDLTIENANNDNRELPATEGTQCLIHGNTAGAVNGQDVFAWVANGRPITVTGGTQNPNPLLQGTANISRSDSIVTVPLYTRRTGGGGGNRLALCTGANCNRHTTVAGFMQLGIVETQPAPGGTSGSFSAFILNVAGCPDPSGNTVSGGGVSPVPVRLITPP